MICDQNIRESSSWSPTFHAKRNEVEGKKRKQMKSLFFRFSSPLALARMEGTLLPYTPAWIFGSSLLGNEEKEKKGTVLTKAEDLGNEKGNKRRAAAPLSSHYVSTIECVPNEPSFFSLNPYILSLHASCTLCLKQRSLACVCLLLRSMREDHRYQQRALNLCNIGRNS